MPLIEPPKVDPLEAPSTIKIGLAIKVWAEKPFVMHTQLATGTSSLDGKPFEVWQAGGTLYVNHDDKSYEVSIRDVVAGIFDKIKETK